MNNPTASSLRDGGLSRPDACLCNGAAQRKQREDRKRGAGGTCKGEEALIRKKLAGMPGVSELSFNLMQRTLKVRHTPSALPAITEDLLFFALTFTGHATMRMAVFADVGASLLVVADGLRALGK